MKEYNKLVRDKIPEIIEQAGKTAYTQILTEEEYLDALDKKLNEELSEYQSDKSIEELADLLEVIYAVVKARGYSVQELECIRKKKAEERGSFDKRIMLKGVSDNGSDKS